MGTRSRSNSMSDDSKSPSPPPSAKDRSRSGGGGGPPIPASPPPRRSRSPRMSPPPRRVRGSPDRGGRVVENGRSHSPSPPFRPRTRSKSGSPLDQQHHRVSIRRSRSSDMNHHHHYGDVKKNSRSPRSPMRRSPGIMDHRDEMDRSRSRERSRRHRSRSDSLPPSRRSHDDYDRGNDDEGYRLHVADLDSNAQKRDLERTFGKFGPLKEIWMARSVPCFAFVVFRYRQDSEEAIAQTDGTELCGRRIRVTPARPRTRGSGRRSFDPNMRCYQCGDRGHFSRDCPDSKWGYKRPPSPRRGGGGGGYYNRSDRYDGGGGRGGDRRY